MNSEQTAFWNYQASWLDANSAKKKLLRAIEIMLEPQNAGEDYNQQIVQLLQDVSEICLEAAKRIDVNYP